MRTKLLLAGLALASTLQASTANVATITDIKEAVAVLIELYAKTNKEVSEIKQTLSISIQSSNSTNAKSLEALAKQIEKNRILAEQTLSRTDAIGELELKHRGIETTNTTILDRLDTLEKEILNLSSNNAPVVVAPLTFDVNTETSSDRIIKDFLNHK